MEISDTELVLRAQTARDDAAFAALMRRHQGRLRAFLTRFTGAEADIDDIAQLAFIKAHRALAEFRGGSSFRSWLFAIAYREFLQQRRRDAAQTRLIETANENGAAESIIPAADLGMDLKAALLRLAENERAALLLCDAAGFTHAEAAATLDEPLGSVKSWVTRARTKMRALLSDTPDDTIERTRNVASATNGVRHG